MIVILNQLYQILPTFIRKSISSFLFAILKHRIRAHFSSFISPNDLVFDIGANVGHLTQIFLELGARVICIEPQPDSIEVLKKRFADNSKITIIEKALGAKEANLPFFISSKSSALSTLSSKWRKEGRYKKITWNKTIDVSVTTLDALIEKYGLPVFCKIDVEGFEKEVIRGLSHRIPIMSFEFTKEFLNDAKACAIHLIALGNCKFNYSLYNTYNLSSKKWQNHQQIFAELESNRSPFLCGDIYVKFAENGVNSGFF